MTAFNLEHTCFLRHFLNHLIPKSYESFHLSQYLLLENNYYKLKQLFWIIWGSEGDHRFPFLCGQLLKNYCVPLVVSYFLAFSCSWKSFTGVFTFEEASMSFCSCWLALRERYLSLVQLGIRRHSQTFSRDTPAPHSCSLVWRNS